MCFYIVVVQLRECLTQRSGHALTSSHCVLPLSTPAGGVQLRTEDCNCYYCVVLAARFISQRTETAAQKQRLQLARYFEPTAVFSSWDALRRRGAAVVGARRMPTNDVHTKGRL